MSAVVVMGEAARVAGYALAGALVLHTDALGVDGAWRRVPDDTGLLVLTAAAADALQDRLPTRPRLLWTVMPT